MVKTHAHFGDFSVFWLCPRIKELASGRISLVPPEMGVTRGSRKLPLDGGASLHLPSGPQASGFPPGPPRLALLVYLTFAADSIS